MKIKQAGLDLTFTAMKPNQFKGFDYACVRKFKAPVEKFNSINDFNQWAKDRFSRIQGLEYRARDDEITVQRRSMLEEWAGYLQLYVTIPSACLIAIESLTRNLKKNTDTLPPVLNKTIVNETFDNLQHNLNKDKNYQFNFNKIYEENLQTQFGEDNLNKTGWIVIPSKIHDSKNFEYNVHKLKTLSAKTWCTKNIQGEIYLAEGDFNLYLENGKTKYCLRFQGNSIIEIQNERNDTKIDYQCFKEISKYVKANKFSLSSMAKVKFDEAETKFSHIEGIDDSLYPAIIKNNTEEILYLLGYKPQKLTDGTLSIEEYCQPSKYFTFEELGIDEDKLLADICEIRGNAFFENSTAQTTGNIKYIGGDLDCGNSQLQSTEKVEKVGGDLNLNNSQIKSTGKIKEIGGNAYLDNSYITDLKEIERIGGSLFLNKNTTTLGNLKSIGRDVNFNVRHLSLGNLENVGGDVYIGEGVYSLGSLREIGGDFDIADSKLTHPGNLEFIKGNVFIAANSSLNKEKFDNIITGNIIETENYAF